MLEASAEDLDVAIGTEFAKGFMPSGKLVGADVSKTSSAGSSPASGDFKT